MHGSNRDRIMVVDDEEFCMATMRHLLNSMGIDADNLVDFCINGREALNTVQDAMKFGITYKLILTDFSMPEMDGVESTSLIRDFYRRENLARNK